MCKNNALTNLIMLPVKYCNKVLLLIFNFRNISKTICLKSCTTDVMANRIANQ